MLKTEFTKWLQFCEKLCRVIYDLYAATVTFFYFDVLFLSSSLSSLIKIASNFNVEMSKAKGKVEVVEAPVIVAKVEEVITGKGDFLLPDNSKYSGEWKEIGGVKQRHGNGVWISGPEKYAGLWENDSMSGEGVIFVFISLFVSEDIYVVCRRVCLQFWCNLQRTILWELFQWRR